MEHPNQGAVLWQIKFVQQWLQQIWFGESQISTIINTAKRRFGDVKCYIREVQHSQSLTLL